MIESDRYQGHLSYTLVRVLKNVFSNKKIWPKNPEKLCFTQDPITQQLFKISLPKLYAKEFR